jgi:TonB family protein
MLSTNTHNSRWLILGKILILVIVAAAFIRSYLKTTPANFIDPFEFIFILVGGIALLMISFRGTEVRRALLHSVGVPGNDAEIKQSIYLWEAAVRGFWMLGGLGSILNLMIGFIHLRTEQVNGLGGVIDELLTRGLLATFYGILLAVICLIPFWKLIGKLKSRPLQPEAERGETSISIRLPGWSWGTVMGYVLFLAALAYIPFNFSFPKQWAVMVDVVHSPSLLVVVGGALVLMLFSGDANSGRSTSASFAAMGLIGCLMGCIQVLSGIISFSRSGKAVDIAGVANGNAFLLFCCFAALMGMMLVGAPLADRAIRTGQIIAPSTSTRLSWYGFPILTLILAPLIVAVMTMPLPRPEHQLTEVSAPVQVQKARYEARPPQSEPLDFVRGNIQETYLIYKVNPAYPGQAKREGIQGTVRLRIIINEEGFVYEVKGNPENNPVLEQAAIPAVKRWRFSPFLMKGVPVAIETTATVNFTLK